VVVVMSALSSLLFYWCIMTPVVRGFSWALERTLDVGSASQRARDEAWCNEPD
jgi:concentrative nucleoside transporter, CNT family